MEWLTSLLGMGGATAPFGALGASSTGAGGAAPGLGAATKAFGAFNPSSPAETLQQSQANTPPGIWGNQLNNGQMFALNQAMKMLQPPPLQPAPAMKLLSGPGPGGA